LSQEGVKKYKLSDSSDVFPLFSLPLWEGIKGRGKLLGLVSPSPIKGEGIKEDKNHST
jgi:hypothetical protein